MTFALILVTLSGSYSTTPEIFLDSLCANRSGFEGARLWISSAWEPPEAPFSDTDSMTVFLEGLTDLSVATGVRVLGDVDDVTGQYRVEYPESIWTWRGSDGKMYRIAGPSVVIWSNGRFYWETLPLLRGEAAGIGVTERFLSALFFMVLILLFGVLFLIWAKRKFGT